MTSVCGATAGATAGVAAAEAGAGAAAGAATAGAAAIATGAAAVPTAGAGGGASLLATLALNTYGAVTRRPLRSASAQLKNETDAPLIPVILSCRGTNSPATPFASLLPVFGSTRQ